MAKEEILKAISASLDNLKERESMDDQRVIGSSLKKLQFKDENVVSAVFKEYLLALGKHYTETDEEIKKSTQESLNLWTASFKLSLVMFSEE